MRQLRLKRKPSMIAEPFRNAQLCSFKRSWSRLAFWFVQNGQQREELMKHLFTTTLVTAALALPLAAVAQERYPELKPEQLSAQQKAYVESLAKPPRNNTTALKNPPFKVYMRSPDLAGKLEAMSDYVRWGTGLEPRLTELAIMITARQWSSQWIWRGH